MTVVEREPAQHIARRVDDARRWGVRDEAMPAWRRLNAALAQLADLGVHTPCDVDPEEFVGEDLDRRRAAAAACCLCPVIAACGDFARLNGERLGVWGGRDRTWGALADLRRRQPSDDASGGSA